MTIRASKFDAEVLLSAPRRSAGLPNQAGTLVVYTQSIYSFDQHEKTTEIRVLDLKSKEVIVIGDADLGNPKWINNTKIALLRSEEEKTVIVVGEVYDFAKTREEYPLINAAVSDWKLYATGDGFKVALVAPVVNGSLHNSKEESHSTGRLYKNIMVRHWDKWITPVKNSIWVGNLSTKFAVDGLVLATHGLESPVPPFGGASDFDINNDYLVFVAKDPHLNKATNTKQNVYVVDLKSHSLKQIKIGLEGASSNPILFHGKVAFLSMRLNGYESDKNQIIVYDIAKDESRIPYGTDDLIGSWDRSPSSLLWRDGLLATAADRGRVSIFEIKSDGPKCIFEQGSVNDMTLTDTGLFVSTSSLVDNSAYWLVETAELGSSELVSSKRVSSIELVSSAKLISSASDGGLKFGLRERQVDQIFFPGAKAQIQAWVIKPSSFDPKKKYPLAFLIHGGPQGAWEDSWSTRWNPAVYAEQGYVVVTPNPTGSTGFGQALTDAIQKEWGGLPYQDLVSGFDWIENNLDYVDTSRAVALGASYGGYMAAWIQGNDLGRRFKAIVMHDGVFNITTQLSTEELYFPNREFGGVFWDNKDEWRKWDPSSRTEHWATPMLIIHSEKDFRLTIAEGLAAFNVLQSKGIESQFLTFPDENHWVLKPENSLLWHTAVLDFINAKVGLPLYSDQNARAKALKEAAWSD